MITLHGQKFECSIYREGQYLFDLRILAERQIDTLNGITRVLSNAEIHSINSHQIDKVDESDPEIYRIVLYGYFPPNFIDENEPIVNYEEKYRKLLSQYALNQSKENVNFRLYNDFIIEDGKYQIIQLHNPLRISSTPKPTTFISGDWFNRFSNDLAYSISNRDNRLGVPIGNAGMHIGMKLGHDINVYYNSDKIYRLMKKYNVTYSLVKINELIKSGKIESELKIDSDLFELFKKIKEEWNFESDEDVIEIITGKRNIAQHLRDKGNKNTLITLEIQSDFPLNIILKKVLKAYGYAHVEEVKNIISSGNIVGYKFIVKSHVFLYNDSCDDREFVVKRANSRNGFKKRNCFFFRDMLKGIVERLNEYIEPSTFVPLNSQYVAFEYEIHKDGENIFENDRIELLGNDFFSRIGDDLERIDTCAYLRSKESGKSADDFSCDFYAFKRSFVFDV